MTPAAEVPGTGTQPRDAKQIGPVQTLGEAVFNPQVVSNLADSAEEIGQIGTRAATDPANRYNPRTIPGIDAGGNHGSGDEKSGLSIGKITRQVTDIARQIAPQIVIPQETANMSKVADELLGKSPLYWRKNSAVEDSDDPSR